MFDSKSRFLVTGGSGFIGSHLIEELLKRGASVTVFDVKITANLDAARGNPRVTLIQGDITKPGEVAKACEGAAGVFHMAVLPMGDSNKNPALCFDVNVLGMRNVLEGAAAAGAKKIVYSSASSVYGDTLELTDETHPFNANTMYGASKAIGEFLLRGYAASRKLDFVALRYMNVYGPRLRAGLFWNVLDKISKNEAPTIHGEGNQSFDFVHAADVVQANLLAMEKPVANEAFNVGSGTEATVKEIVALFLELTRSPLKPAYMKDARVEMVRRVGKIEKARKMLGYEPKVSLREGLKSYVNWYQKENSGHQAVHR